MVLKRVGSTVRYGIQSSCTWRSFMKGDEDNLPNGCDIASSCPIQHLQRSPIVSLQNMQSKNREMNE